MVSPLDTRPREDATDPAIAREAVAQWRAIEASLAPIIGQHGFVVLFKRSVFVAAKAHPWLAHDDANEKTMDLDALAGLLSARAAAQAAAGADALLQAFRELLASLIGAPLAERLMGPSWSPSPSGPAAQDKSP